MKFENINELNNYINSNYKKANITGVDTENLEIFIDGEVTKNKQYAFIKFSDEKAYMQYKNQHDIAGIDYLKVVSHQINLEEFYILMDSKKVAYIEFIEIVEEIETVEEYVLAKDADFSGETDGNFRYIGTDEYVEIPHVIKGINVTSYANMFRGTSVRGVISTNDNITNMGDMFRDSQATSLDLSSFDTSNVTDMSYMFRNSKATSLDLSSFHTSRVTTMSYMFYQSQATSLDISSFDTSRVTSMRDMFYGSQVTSLDLSHFNTSSLISMDGMFYNSQVALLDLSNFNTSSVLSMSSMFQGSQATSLDLSSFNTSNVTSMVDMFRDSQATIGYARTQADADKFNSSSNKPNGLTFIVEDIEEDEEEGTEPGELTYTDTTLGWAFDRANIEYAWERGYTGKGIKALIVDKGFHDIPGELEFVDVYGEDDLTGAHGTLVASCLGAKMNNTGLVGVAPDIELYGFAKREGGSIHGILPEFINYIIDNGIRIVNFSVVIPGVSPSQTVIDAFEYLDSLGVLVFAGQGNFGQNFGRSLYSIIPTTIGVGGILLDDNNNLEISTGPLGATNNVDCDYLFSYGTNVLLRDGTVTQSSGTSFGTPSIAGMFALLMQEFPNATKKELMDIMNYGGEKVDNYYGIFPKYGGHLEQLVEIYPPDWDSKLKVYPVTLSSGVIEKGNKLFVNKEEREYLEKVKRKEFVETILHEDENTIRPPEANIIIWVGDIVPRNALSGDILITSESLRIKQGEEWADLNPENKVDKVEGKGLSTNDYTTDEKDKLSEIVVLSNVDNVKQMPISGGVLENYREKLTTVSANGGSIDLSLGNAFQHTPSGNRTYSITNAVSGEAHSFTLIINMGSTVRTLTFPASVKWQGGEIPDITTPNKTYILTFMTVDGGDSWLGMFGGEF